jgi:hypothetical protein
MGIVDRAFRAGASMPTTMIPRQSLISGDGSIRKLADEGMNTNLAAVWLILIPVIVVLVYTK